MSRAMKDSGVPWLKEIPVDWKVERGKNVLALQKRPVRDNDEVVTCFRDGEVILRSLRRTEGFTMSDKEIGYQGINEGDIVIHGMDGFAGAMGVSKSTGKASPVLIVCTPKYDAIPQYIIYYLRALAMTDVFVALATGIRERSCDLRWNKVSELEFIMPSSSEQQAIVEFLDRKCAEVDEMIALQEQIIEELKAYKQSVITEAVTKGLNPDVPMKDSGIEWIGQIPEHWEVKPIKYIKSKEKNSFADGPFGSNLKSEHFVENGDALVIESGFITTGKFIYKDFKTITKEHFETIKRSECKAKDIIIAKIGANYGMSGELPVLDKPSVVSGNSLKITLDNKKYLNPIFVYAMMTAKSNKGFLDLVQENAQPALSLSGLNNFRLPSAPIEEQQAIADYLDDKCADIDALIATKQQKIDSLKEYKKSIIYEYVTGKKEIA